MTTSGMSDVEKLAFSVDASLRGSDSKSSAGASRGVRLVARLSAYKLRRANRRVYIKKERKLTVFIHFQIARSSNLN